MPTRPAVVKAAPTLTGISRFGLPPAFPACCVWFGIIERHAIHRGTFASVKDLTTKIRKFINGWNDRCQPFVWTKTADQILAKANRQKNSPTDH